MSNWMPDCNATSMQRTPVNNDVLRAGKCLNGNNDFAWMKGIAYLCNLNFHHITFLRRRDLPQDVTLNSYNREFDYTHNLKRQ